MKMRMPCNKCHGVVTDTTCPYCRGNRFFPKPEDLQILVRIVGSRGKNAGQFRITSPSRDGVHGRRAYYVWRMARFHGGEDVSMPILAEKMVQGDPYLPYLNTLATEVAKRTFGTHLGAVKHYRGLLGGGK
jgi:RNA polymerase subunit RPABC4/transcription elongation factor Spt4